MGWNVIAATAVAILLLWLCWGFIERKFLLPLVARMHRGAWADNPRYWAFSANRKAAEERRGENDDGDEIPELVSRDKEEERRLSQIRAAKPTPNEVTLWRQQVAAALKNRHRAAQPAAAGSRNAPRGKRR